MKRVDAINQITDDLIVINKVGNFYELYNKQAARIAVMTGMTDRIHTHTVDDMIVILPIPYWLLAKTTERLTSEGLKYTILQ